jgi:hypothetical protein
MACAVREDEMGFRIGLGLSAALALAGVATAVAAADGVVVATRGDRLIVQRCESFHGGRMCERASCAKGADGKPEACSAFVKPELEITSESPATAAVISFPVRPFLLGPISAARSELGLYDFDYDPAHNTRFEAKNGMGLLQVTAAAPCSEAVKRFHAFLAQSANIPSYSVGHFDRTETCHEEPFRGVRRWPPEVRF